MPRPARCPATVSTGSSSHGRSCACNWPPRQSVRRSRTISSRSGGMRLMHCWRSAGPRRSNSPALFPPCSRIASWSRITVFLTVQTRIQGNLAAGARVQVEGLTQPDGTVVGTKIKVLGPEGEDHGGGGGSGDDSGQQTPTPDNSGHGGDDDWATGPPRRTILGTAGTTTRATRHRPPKITPADPLRRFNPSTLKGQSLA